MKKDLTKRQEAFNNNNRPANGADLQLEETKQELGRDDSHDSTYSEEEEEEEALESDNVAARGCT